MRIVAATTDEEMLHTIIAAYHHRRPNPRRHNGLPGLQQYEGL